MHNADDFITFPHATPEQRLIASVLHRAVLDLFGVVNLVANPEEGDVAKYDALRFLTAKSGAWAKRRDELCLCIDLNGDFVRAKVIDILEGRADPKLALTQRVDAIEVARAMWRDEEDAVRRAAIAREAQREVVAARRLNVRAAARRPKVKPPSKTSDEKVLDALRDGHTTIRTINFYLDGNVPNEKIRKSLLAAKDKGLVVKDGIDWFPIDDAVAA